jgi:two-component system, sensor histidine kinase YesM
MRFFHTIFFKLFIILSLFSVFPLLIAEWITYNYISLSLYENINEKTLSMQEEKIKTLNSFINDLQRMELTIARNPVTSKILETNKMDDFPLHFKEFDTMLNSVSIIRPENVGITIVNDNGFVYNYNYPLNRDNSNFRKFDWVKEINLSQKFQLSSLHDRPYSYQNGNIHVFSYIKRLSSYDLKSGGLLIIDFNIDVLNKLFSDMTSNDNNGIIVVDDKSNLIYPFSEDIDFPINSLKSESISWLGSKYRLIHRYNEQAGWTIHSYYNESELYKPVYKIRNLSIAIILVSMIVCAIVSFIISFRFSSPIKQLHELMRRVSIGDFNHRFNSNRKDEIGELGLGFNLMIVKIKDLLNQVYSEQIQKRRAERMALQAQINPHFLYNTLEAINALARKNKENQISKMIVSLGKLLRFNIGTFEEIVTISEEVNYVKNYLELYKFRLQSKMHYSIQMDEKISSLYTVKWVLQPIVENAIMHGYEGVEKDRIIKISGGLKNNDVYLTVKDLGKGIEEAKLNQILRNLEIGYENEIKNKKSIGLFNVQSRIKLHYGDQYGIHIESTPNIGTSVTIKIPRRDSND